MSKVDIGVYIDGIDELVAKKCVWVVFSHVSQSVAGKGDRLILSLRDRVGSRFEEFEVKGASAHHCDLSQPSEASVR